VSEPRINLWGGPRRLTPSEALWLAVLDQACADAGSPNPRIRAEAAEWWASEVPGILAYALDIPLSKLVRLRAARGGLRMTAETGHMGRRLGVRVVQRDQYQYGRDRRARAPKRPRLTVAFLG
jgi:hypothetical protein